MLYVLLVASVLVNLALAYLLWRGQSNRDDLEIEVSDGSEPEELEEMPSTPERWAARGHPSYS